MSTWGETPLFMVYCASSTQCVHTLQRCSALTAFLDLATSLGGILITHHSAMLLPRFYILVSWHEYMRITQNLLVVLFGRSAVSLVAAAQRRSLAYLVS